MGTRFPYPGYVDTANSCGDPLDLPCEAVDGRDRIWYVTPTCALPLPGWRLLSQDAACAVTEGDITDLDDVVVVGAVQVAGPAPLGAGGFVVGAYCGA